MSDQSEAANNRVKAPESNEPVISGAHVDVDRLCQCARTNNKQRRFLQTSLEGEERFKDNFLLTGAGASNYQILTFQSLD